MTLNKITYGSAWPRCSRLGACNEKGTSDTSPPDRAAKDAAGKATIASGLGDATKFELRPRRRTGWTLGGPGPYTVLVPGDAAFDKLPAGALDTLMKPEARAELTGVLTYHILPGRSLRRTSARRSRPGRAKRCSRPWPAARSTATKEGDAIVISDAAGTKARITGGTRRSPTAWSTISMPC